MFSIRYFKKGSAHITFRKPELVDRMRCSASDTLRRAPRTSRSGNQSWLTGLMILLPDTTGSPASTVNKKPQGIKRYFTIREY
ncbi:DUF4942 domain-containing protein [Escherichia coli]|nr:DUF4942 domain-containing protein [Escherichia coli]